MERTLRVLQIEDNESDAELVARALRTLPWTVRSARVQDAAALRVALANSGWDAVICDYRMPGFSAPEALAIVRASGLDLPFIVVSGTIGEELAVAMMRAGAHDYLMKDSLARLASTVEREVREAAVRAERTAALSALREREAQLAVALEATELGIFDYYPRTGMFLCSDMACRHFGVPPGHRPTRDSFFKAVHPSDLNRVQRAIDAAIEPSGSGVYAEEFQLSYPVEGETRWISSWGRVSFDELGSPDRFLGAVRNVTMRKKAEQSLQFQLQLTARIAEQSTECIMLADFDGTVRFVNPEMERVLGFTLEDFRGQSPHELMHHHRPDGQPYPAGECPLTHCMRSGQVLRDHEDLLFHKNGTKVEVSVSCVPLEMDGRRAGIVFVFRDITERKRSERALRRQEIRFRRLFEADVTGIMITDSSRVLECNDNLLRMLGYSRADFFAEPKTWRELTAPDQMAASEFAYRELMTRGSIPGFEMEYLRKDGSRISVLIASVELTQSNQPEVLSFIIDLTERKSLENQMRQAQKLESIGQLAGGVAHDFNNLLTVIVGYARMLLAGTGGPEDTKQGLEEILAAGHRATDLSRQLLTFSRRHTGAPRDLNLNQVVSGIEDMVGRLIGEMIEVKIDLTGAPAVVHADKGLLEQVIVNLAVNARDAMPEGGSLVIRTSRILVGDELAALCLSVPAGDYVELNVSDSGIGMTLEVQAHLFEPFFTTKEPGKGTGLGLSTVYGIVTQSGGFVRIHSAPGLGTTVRVLWPAATGPVAADVPEQRIPAPRGTETVLLAEDQAGVRKYVSEVLQGHGYQTLTADSGDAAVLVAGQHRHEIDLVLTDYVLPGLSGPEVIRRVRELCPDVPAILMSGYPEGVLLGQVQDAHGLRKPFSPDELLNLIRVALDQPARKLRRAGVAGYSAS